MKELVFYTCGCCGIEEGLSKLKLIDEDLLEKVKHSKLVSLYENMIKPLLPDSNANKYEISFAKSVKNELNEYGLLKNAKYLCKICIRSLPRKTRDNSRSEPNKKYNEGKKN